MAIDMTTDTCHIFLHPDAAILTVLKWSPEGLAELYLKVIAYKDGVIFLKM
jgi:hypothetical protein